MTPPQVPLHNAHVARQVLVKRFPVRRQVRREKGDGPFFLLLVPILPAPRFDVDLFLGSISFSTSTACCVGTDVVLKIIGQVSFVLKRAHQIDVRVIDPVGVQDGFPVSLHDLLAFGWLAAMPRLRMFRSWYLSSG